MKSAYLFLVSLLCLPGIRPASAQLLVVDPAVSGAIAVNSSTINGQLGSTNNKLDLIGRGQLAVSSELVIVNSLQNKIYEGLSQVSAVLNNLWTVKDISEAGLDIVRDVQAAIGLARTNPLLLLFAEQGARDFKLRATRLAGEVSTFVLKGGKGQLMDAGERGKLLNHIATEMRILRGIAYGMQRSMYWAKMEGIFRSLNPWAVWQNQDIRIAGEVIAGAQYLKP